jgi:hypothetical protein
LRWRAAALERRYGFVIVRRLDPDLKPVFEDWLCLADCRSRVPRSWQPALSCRNTGASLFVIAGGTHLLLFVGIHNAWDAVTPRDTKGPEGDEDEDSIISRAIRRDDGASPLRHRTLVEHQEIKGGHLRPVFAGVNSTCRHLTKKGGDHRHRAD